LVFLLPLSWANLPYRDSFHVPNLMPI
jgi:hypothetical protein